MPRVPLQLLKSKNPEHSHDVTENIMAHCALRKLNEKETSQIVQMSQSLLIQRKIKAQLCRQRKNDRPLLLQDIENQVKKIKKDKLKGRRPIDSLIQPSKKKRLCGSIQGMLRDKLPPCFPLTPL
ncbi:hypothetical protein O181_040332 [Austropuccinia psidii MF-1]|uniref:Uncharacterized protein n=1 Tax=Austropuccinia psidii MF-1 TaxID=1389203 RepID=A0A9Q3DEL8_9BASI|nr:hypothetical protein [Austropuccinia psidii MF-1]